MRTVSIVLVLVLGCGDNEGAPGPDAPPVGRCAPEQGPLPTAGAFADPLALPLSGCVEGGLEDLPGRWFLVDPASEFAFQYPRFEGSCDTGFRNPDDPPDDHDDADGVTFHTWSDGTRFYSRRRFAFTFPEGTFEFVSALATCMRDDGTLSGVAAQFTTDTGELIAEMSGTRFDRKDEPASGLELVGELGSFGPNPEDRIFALNLVVDGTHAYVVGFLGLDVIDISDPAQPRAVGRLEGSFNDVRVVSGGGKTVAFLAPLDGDKTLAVDVTDPTNPTVAATINEFSHSLQVATAGNATHLYLATYGDTVPRYDVTNPVAPVRLGAAQVPGEPFGVHDLTVDGDRLLVNYTDGGFVAVDISGGLDAATGVGQMPSSYSHASAVGTTSTGRQIILHGDEGMTGTPDGGAFLRVLEGDRSSPDYLKEIGRYQSRPEVGIHNIELVGDLVYLGYYQDGVRVVDVSDPEQPREVAHFNTWDPETAPDGAFEGAFGVRVVGDLLYVPDSVRGLVILRKL